MNTFELLDWLHEKNRQWEAFLEQCGPATMDTPGVTEHWSLKDVVGHLAGWNRWLVARLQAAQTGQGEPSPPWPADLDNEDEINAWIYESNRNRPARDVLDETRQVFQQLIATIEALPDSIRIETIQASADRAFYMVWIGEQRFPVGEFFDHFQDDHEPDVRAWLARGKNPKAATAAVDSRAS